MSDWNDWPLVDPVQPVEDDQLPLWLRTQRRLDRMATWSLQRMTTSDGLDPVIQMREEKIRCASAELCLRLRRWEERQIGGGKTT
jgi:hypothetical protein